VPLLVQILEPCEDLAADHGQDVLRDPPPRKLLDTILEAARCRPPSSRLQSAKYYVKRGIILYYTRYYTISQFTSPLLLCKQSDCEQHFVGC
jgi:hypothetical protein